MDTFTKQKKIIIDILFILSLIAISIIVFEDFKSVIAPFIYGSALAYILNPAVRILEKRKIKRIWAIIIIFVVFLLIVGIFFGTFVPKLSNDIGALLKDLPSIAEFVTETISRIESGELLPIPEIIGDYLNVEEEIKEINKHIGTVLKGVVDKIVKSTGTFIDIIMTPVIAFYLLKDKDKIMTGVKKSIPHKHKKSLNVLCKDIDRSFGGFIKGQLLIAVFIGTLTGLGCHFIGVPYSLTIGLIAGVTNIIPYFGPFIGGILPVILAFMDNPISALWVIVLIFVLQQVESVFISPQIMSYSVGIHPILVMFSVLFFGRMFGVVGMIIGVPVMSTLLILMKRIISHRRALNT